MFKIDYNTLTQVRELRVTREKIEEQEKKLLTAILTDVSLIPAIYEWYKEVQRKEVWKTEVGSRKFRKQFIFLILYLYSPETLAGVNKMAKGVRPALAKILGFKSPAGISNLCSDLLFLYSSYKDFRWEINIMYTYLIEKLKEEGYVAEAIQITHYNYDCIRIAGNTFTPT